MKFNIPAGEASRFDAVCAVARDGDTIEALLERFANARGQTPPIRIPCPNS